MTRARHQLAGLSAHAFGAAARHRQLCRADSCVSAGAVRRRLGGAPQSPQAAGVDAGRRRQCSRSPWPRSRSRSVINSGDHRSQPACRASSTPSTCRAANPSWCRWWRIASDLSNAIAINSSMANGARLIGPAIAGLVIAAFGEGWCFLIDGVSYFAVIASLLMMRIAPIAVVAHAQPRMFEQMREGWDYVRTFRPIRTILLLFALVSLMGYPYVVLLPHLRRRGAARRSAHAGLADGRFGRGRARLRRSRWPSASRVVGLDAHDSRSPPPCLECALILFGLSHVFWLSLSLMVFAGFGMMQGAAASNTIIQTLVPEDKRARVMSYYTMAFFGAGAVRQPAGRRVGSQIGAPHTVMRHRCVLHRRLALVRLRAAVDQRRHAVHSNSKRAARQSLRTHRTGVSRTGPNQP